MFDDHIRFQASFRPDSRAVIGHGGERSFGQFEAHIRRAVHELSDFEVPTGESVAVAVRGTYLEWVLILALARLGIAAAAFDDWESRYRISDNPDQEGAAAFILTDERVARIANGPDRPFVRRAVDPEALGHVFRTSGTTGDAKRVGISWRAMEANIQHIVTSHVGIPGTWFAATGIETQLGFYYAVAAWFGGNASVVGFPPNAPVFLEVRPRLIAFVPAQIQYLLDTLPPDHVPWPLRIVSGGSSFPLALAREIRSRLTSDVFLNYACTEASQVATATLDLVEQEPRAAGYLRPDVELRILDDSGHEVAPGEAGRLCFRTRRLTSGYVDDPARTAACYRDGWFHSSDVGRLRDDGLLLLEGRADELMNLGGQKVLPAWIEEAVLRCPAIRETAVFAVATESGLNACAIAIVTERDFVMADLAAALKGRLPPVQRILVYVLDALPRNAMGKVERNRLPELATAVVPTVLRGGGANARATRPPAAGSTPAA